MCINFAFFSSRKIQVKEAEVFDDRKKIDELQAFIHEQYENKKKYLAIQEEINQLQKQQNELQDIEAAIDIEISGQMKELNILT